MFALPFLFLYSRLDASLLCPLCLKLRAGNSHEIEVPGRSQVQPELVNCLRLRAHDLRLKTLKDDISVSRAGTHRAFTNRFLLGSRGAWHQLNVVAVFLK